MFWLIVNPSQEIITNATYIANLGQQITPPFAVGSYRHSWIDATNKYIYFVYWQSAAPRFRIIRYSYATPWTLTWATEISLSWFWTFSAQPIFNTFQGWIDWNFYIFRNTTAWSWVPTALSAYPVTISWTTATLWTANTLPVIASYTVSKIFASWTTLYAFYSLTASPYTCDTGRKWNWSSRDTLTGWAIPSSLWTMQDWANSRLIYNKFFTSIWAWANHNKFFTWFQTTNSTPYFDTSTDTWYLSSVLVTSTSLIWVDVNWFVRGSNGLFDNSLQTISFANNYAPWTPSDILNWYVCADFSSTITIAWATKWTNKRIRRVAWNALASWVRYLLYSIDWWTTRKALHYISTLISDNYNLNLFWANMIAISCIMWETSNIYLTAEVVS